MTTTARTYTDYWGTMYFVTHNGREYTVSSLDPEAPYTQVLLHGERKLKNPWGPNGDRTHTGYIRRVEAKGKLGRLLIEAARKVAVP